MSKAVNEELLDRFMRLPPRIRGWLLAEDEGVRECELRGIRHDHPERPDFYGPHGPPGHGEPHRRHEELHGMRERGATFAKERVLRGLLDHEAGLPQEDIAEEIGGDHFFVTELIDKLENGGYVERTIAPSDSRATLVTLTEKGKARAYELEDGRNARLNAMFENLTEDEKKKLICLLDKLMAEHDEDNEGGDN